MLGNTPAIATHPTCFRLVPVFLAWAIAWSMLLMVDPGPPQVIWWDGEFNGMISTDLTWHKGTVKTIMTGSKSPTIVNEAQTFAIRYGLAQLS